MDYQGFIQVVTLTPPGVVTRDGAGEGRWTDRGAGPLTGLRVREESGGWITHVSAR